MTTGVRRAGVIGVAISLSAGSAFAGQLGSLLNELGASAETLAASGIDATGATGVLDALEEASEQRQAYAEAQSSLSELIQAFSSAEAQLLADPDNETLQAAFESTSSQLAAAQSTAETTRSLLVQTIATAAGETAGPKLSRAIVNRGRPVPVYFRVLDHTESDWLTIERALRHAESQDAGRAADRSAEIRASLVAIGKTVEVTDAELLTAVSAGLASDTDVAAAHQLLQTNGSEVAALLAGR